MTAIDSLLILPRKLLLDWQHAHAAIVGNARAAINGSNSW